MGKTTIQKPAFDATIVLGTHEEGRVMHATIRSLKRSLDHALRNGLKVEVIIVLDNVNELTKKYVDENLKNIIGHVVPVIVKEVSFSDAAPTRNYGISLARGAYVGVLDADDLISENMITASVETLRKQKEPVIVHPEYLVSFDSINEIWHLSGSKGPGFDKAAMVEYNPWPLPSFASNKLRDSFKYKPVNPKEGFGPEDWQWHIDTIEAGIDHVIAPKTVYFYRRKAVGSLARKHQMLRLLLRKSSLLRDQRLKPMTPNFELPEEFHRHVTISQKLSVVPRYTLAKTGRVIGPAFRRYKRTQAFEHYMRIAFRELPATSAPVSHDKETKKYCKVLIDEWKIQHNFEHKLYPDSGLLQRIENHKPIASRFSFIYWDLLKKLPLDADFIFLIPWLKTGGADLVITNYVKAVLRDNPNAKVALIATEVTESPWKDRLPEAATFITLSHQFYSLDPERRTRLLAQLLVELAPKNIHLINSDVGYKTFSEYAKQLSSVSRLFVSAFCFDFTPSGQRVNYLLDHLDYSIDYVQKVLTDNSQIIDDLVELQALPRSKFSINYQPYTGVVLPLRAQVRTRYTSKEPLKVLWAGRIDKQKRPDILMKVATAVKSAGLPIEFHMYGNQVLDKDDTIEKIKAHSNITYHGGFTKGLGEIDISKYDLYLTTTQYEGLPNILFEVIAGGLPVMAPAVGGIPEIIQKGKTGYLVSAFEDVKEYVSLLKEYLGNPAIGLKYAENAQKLMHDRHSWEPFMEKLTSDGYFRNEALPIELMEARKKVTTMRNGSTRMLSAKVATE